MEESQQSGNCISQSDPVSVAQQMDVRYVDPFGGFRCPHCDARVLIPDGYALTPGQIVCPACRFRGLIDDDFAAEANGARRDFVTAIGRITSPQMRLLHLGLHECPLVPAKYIEAPAATEEILW